LTQVQFVKYQGTGNDFILIEDLYGNFPSLDKEFTALLCDRHFGIGADGLVLCQSSSKADFRMRYFNSDGLEAAMCGNALRCLIAFLRDQAMIDKSCQIETAVGIHDATITRDGKIFVSMMMPSLKKMHKEGAHVLSSVDHFVVMSDDLFALDVQKEGERIRYDRRFKPNGVNVNFVHYSGKERFMMRTYEKGVEAETLSCGTGAVAAAFVLKNIMNLSVSSVEFASKEILEFSFEAHRVWISGKTERVFEGFIIPKKSKNIYDTSKTTENISYAHRHS